MTIFQRLEDLKIKKLCPSFLMVRATFPKGEFLAIAVLVKDQTESKLPNNLI